MSTDAPITLPPQSFYAPMLSFGAAFVGFSVATFLTGALMVQMYLYFTASKGAGDSKWLKGLVVAVWTMDFIQLVFQGHYIYTGLVLNFGNLSWFAFDTWSFNLARALSVFITVCVQLFYARRLYILTDHSIWLPGMIVVLSLVNCGFGLALVVLVFKFRKFSDYASFSWVIQTWFAFLIACDLTIVAGMSYHLKTRKTGFKASDKLVDRLVMLTVNTGIAPTLFELADLVAFIAIPGNFSIVCFGFISPKLYANAFLGTLNARIFIQNGLNYTGQSYNDQLSIGPTFNENLGGNTTLRSGHSTNSPKVIHVRSYTDNAHELSNFSKANHV